MPKPYSYDLRVRVIELIEAGSSRREAAELYGISPSVVVIWAQRWKQTGSISAKPSGGSISPLEEHAEFLLGLIVEQPDLTLDEVVVAMSKVGIVGGRAAVWRFYERHDISFKKKLCMRRSRGARMSCAHVGGGCANKACLTRRGWCSSTKPARILRWCGYADALRVASDWSTTRRMELGKLSPLWAPCDNAE